MVASLSRQSIRPNKKNKKKHTKKPPRDATCAPAAPWRVLILRNRTSIAVKPVTNLRGNHAQRARPGTKCGDRGSPVGRTERLCSLSGPRILRRRPRGHDCPATSPGGGLQRGPCARLCMDRRILELGREAARVGRGTLGSPS